MPKKLITPETANKMREKGIDAKREKKTRDRAFKLFGNYLLGKKTVSKHDIEELGDDTGDFKENRKAVRVLLDLAKMRNKAISTNNVRGYVELLKTVGFHFDQSPEALGGSNNPINLNNRIGPPTDELKKAMEEQARLLGVVDDD